MNVLLIILFILSTISVCQNSSVSKIEQTLSVITLGVNDLKISSDFYENKFGWNPTNTSDKKIKFYELENIHLSLYPKHKLAEDATVSSVGSGFKGFTLALNFDSEEKVDEIINMLREKGVNIIKEPQKVFWGGYSSYIMDPDSNLWEIMYNPFL